MKKFLPADIEKICTGRVRAFALSLPKPEAKPFCYLIFCFTPSPASHANENNSFLILFHILLVRNILRQRGHFICERLTFAFYYLLYYVVNSKVLLFANNYHLHCIRIWISFAFANNSHLNIIIICKAFSFEYHNHLQSIRIWKSFAFNNHLHLKIISIWIL